MSRGVTLVVRKAREGDSAARADLVRASYAEYNTEAFWLFLFQEVTLQGIVLAGAVLFIFCGVGVPACLLVLPAAALVVAAAVRLAHHALAEHQIQCMRQETVGFVVETRGALVATPSDVSSTIIVYADDDDAADQSHSANYSQVVGTLSVCANRGWEDCGGGGWVRGMSVSAGWRRAGVGRALAGAARRWAAAAGVPHLAANTSQLQHAARNLLHALGWECRGWYHRPMCGGALSLLVAHLILELPSP